MAEDDDKDYFDSIQKNFGAFSGRKKSILDKIKKEGKGLPRSTFWWRKKVKEMAGADIDQHKFYSDTKKQHKGRPRIGRMYAFFYNPKHRKTLPYYDRFPLIFPIEYYDDGFLGINLHYLRPRTRIALMDKLVDLASDNKMNTRTKLRISYQILNQAGQYPEIRPTIKRYLFSHVRSKFIQIHPDDWTLAILLPAESFKKERKERVWTESARMVREKKSGGKRPRRRTSRPRRNRTRRSRR